MHTVTMGKETGIPEKPCFNLFAISTTPLFGKKLFAPFFRPLLKLVQLVQSLAFTATFIKMLLHILSPLAFMSEQK